MISERDHWLHVTDDPDWYRNHINDPNIPLDETIAAITAAFPPCPQRVLEIGCGPGRLTKEISALYPGVIVVGTDINPAMLGDDFIGIERDNLRGFTDIDVIYSVAVFQHLPHDQQRTYIVEAYEALRPGGVLRVQFVVGADSGNLCDHKTPVDTMAGWFSQTGFDIHIDRGLAHPHWSWITGRKPL